MSDMRHREPRGCQVLWNCGASLALVCPCCGTELVPGLRFCDACGKQVETQSPLARVDEPAPPSLDQAIQRLVPKEFADRLLATRGQVGRERRTVTILFSDVKGSTAMAEDLDPEDVHGDHGRRL